MINGKLIADIARGCVGTPFQHRGRTPNLGLDCVGLVICVARAAGIVEKTFDVEPYSLRPNGNHMLDLCARYMDVITQDQMREGDVLVVAIDVDPQHLAIIANHPHGDGALSIIHATNKRGLNKVVEMTLRFNRVQKFVAAYRFKVAV